MLTHGTMRIAGSTKYPPRPDRILSIATSQPAKRTHVNISGRAKKRGEAAQSARAAARAPAAQPARRRARTAAITSSAVSAAVAA